MGSAAPTHVWHTRQRSDATDDPLATLDAGPSTIGASPKGKKARHVRFGSQDSDDPLAMDEVQAQAVSELADEFAHVNIGKNPELTAASDQRAAVEESFGPVEVVTEVKKGAIVFEYPVGVKFKTSPEE